jgi:hypothetical protein
MNECARFFFFAFFSSYNGPLTQNRKQIELQVPHVSSANDGRNVNLMTAIAISDLRELMIPVSLMPSVFDVTKL